MTKNVFAGTWEIAAENGMNKSIARFPDVCMSPPSPPAGPIPIPYPDTSFSNNLKSGSSTVKIGGKGAALAQKSYYKAGAGRRGGHAHLWLQCHYASDHWQDLLPGGAWT